MAARRTRDIDLFAISTDLPAPDTTDASGRVRAKLARRVPWFAEGALLATAGTRGPAEVARGVRKGACSRSIRHGGYKTTQNPVGRTKEACVLAKSEAIALAVGVCAPHTATALGGQRPSGERIAGLGSGGGRPRVCTYPSACDDVVQRGRLPRVEEAEAMRGAERQLMGWRWENCPECRSPSAFLRAFLFSPGRSLARR